MELYNAVNVTERTVLTALLLERVFKAANKQGYFPLDVGKAALKCLQAFHPGLLCRPLTRFVVLTVILIFVLQVLLTVETDTDEASEGEEEPGDVGPLPHVQYSGGPLRPSWVVV